MFPADVFPPDVFAPDVFPGTGLLAGTPTPPPVLTGAVVGVFPGDVFPPDVFAPDVFPLTLPGAPVVPPVAADREEKAFRDIEARLVALDLFRRVQLCDGPDDIELPGEGGATASIWWLRNLDVGDSDAQETEFVAERFWFAVCIVVADNHPGQRLFRKLHAVRMCKVALNGADLGGVCLPAYTRVGRGTAVRDSLPNGVAALEGTFVIAVEGMAGQDRESEDY